jgi:hypothetical protein
MLKAFCFATIPVDSESRGFRLQVHDRDLGKQMPIPAIPLEAELHIRAAGIAVRLGIPADAGTPPFVRCGVPELEESDWYVPGLMGCPATAD